MKYNFKFKSNISSKQRPIYKQIISGICYSIVFSLLLVFIIMAMPILISFYDTPEGRVVLICLSLLIGIPSFIELFAWSLK